MILFFLLVGAGMAWMWLRRWYDNLNRELADACRFAMER